MLLEVVQVHDVGRQLSQCSIAYHCCQAWSEKVPTIKLGIQTPIYSYAICTCVYIPPNIDEHDALPSKVESRVWVSQRAGGQVSTRVIQR
jgi:hypothetical protein